MRWPNTSPDSVEPAPPVTRRRFLRLGAAMCATVVAGAARAAGAKVVVVGGGYGGATAARYLALWGAGRIAVTLVEEEAAFVSCPLSNLVLGAGLVGMGFFGWRRSRRGQSSA